MNEVVKSTILIFGTLFPIVNPLGNTPFFLRITGDRTSGERVLLSRRIVLNSFFLLTASLLVACRLPVADRFIMAILSSMQAFLLFPRALLATQAAGLLFGF